MYKNKQLDETRKLNRFSKKIFGKDFETENQTIDLFPYRFLKLSKFVYFKKKL